MESIFRKDVRFVNLDDFRKHQMRSLHMIQGTAQDVSSLVEESAHVNSSSRYTLSNFLRKQGSQSCFQPIEFNEVLTLVEETIRCGMKCINRRARMEAIHSFNGCIGVFCTFKNGRDESSGYEIKELHSIKVVYDVLEEDDFSVKIRLITAFPFLHGQ